MSCPRLEEFGFHRLVDKYAFLQRCRADGKDAVEEILLVASRQAAAASAAFAIHNYDAKNAKNLEIKRQKPEFVNIK